MRLVYTEGAPNAYNKPIITYEPEEQNGRVVTRPCRFLPNQGVEVMGTAEVPVHDALLRLAHDAPFTNLDRVRVTHRDGEALAVPLVYELAGEPKRGSVALRLFLRAVTTTNP